MKLSISNIAWQSESDVAVYSMMKQLGFSGLEIAPTRIFPIAPYKKQTEAVIFRCKLMNEWQFFVCSMQSIWYGIEERIFGTQQERNDLLEYTKRAIVFARILGCKNVVFGCPKNRNVDENSKRETAVEFFKILGDFADSYEVVIAFEPNPTIYGTNFINTTKEAFEFVKEVGCHGLKVNLDFGTIIENSETLSDVEENFPLVNHVHISEPFLEPIKSRPLHRKLADMLTRKKYDGYVSIEMKKCDDINAIFDAMRYVSEVFS